MGRYGLPQVLVALGNLKNGVMQEGILDDISTSSFYQAFSVDSKRDIIWASTQGTAGVYFLQRWS